MVASFVLARGRKLPWVPHGLESWLESLLMLLFELVGQNGVLTVAPIWLDARIEDSAKALKKNPVLVPGSCHGTSASHFHSSHLDYVGKNEVEV
ncbi:hypothetical protein CRG98_029704 [Punica granatum]|uniref:Uncharacterized protein n=1 Tax=Punica granatum TaxID=22663 RepID=A0A2I0J1X5_PUNGR|nr:hypothetical protein CRG98_029704 [Punica granatum]